MSETDKINLESVAKSFQYWRDFKKSGERIPSGLWAQVKAIRNDYPRGKIIQRLRISTQQYCRYVDTTNDNSTLKAVSARKQNKTSPFVRVTNPVADAVGELQIELMRPDGLTLRCKHPNHASLQATFDWFVRLSCCS